MVKAEKIMVTEHIVEIRHAAVGSFLDVRGFVADYIREAKFLNHWKIETNVVSFRDAIEKVEKEGAFAGYKSFGYFTYNPPTKNFFQERASVFIKLLSQNKYYNIPDITRFGCRSKIFIPCNKDFESISKLLFENFIANSLREIVGHKESDLQLVLEYKDKSFDSRLILGPMHKNEVKSQMSFDSEHFEKIGLYLDIDIFKTDDINKSKIPVILKDAMHLIWEKVDSITIKLGI